MIHFATTHVKSPRWIDVQLGYLRRFAGVDYRVHACLDEIDASYDARFDQVTRMTGRHYEKLNLLGEQIVSQASDEDVLIFLDGDAFPIAELEPRLADSLTRVPLVAVRRDENLGDRQPHPSFCATTVGFWKRIEGDWAPGYKWRTTAGYRVSDVGGNLLGELERRGIDWEPLLRTNRRNLHPLWFGIYGDLVYHHGSGFRRPYSRLDRERFRRPMRVPIMRRRRQERRERQLDQEKQESQRQSDLVFARIESDPDFYRDLFLSEES